MTEQSTHTRKFQWKWVGITIAVYVVLYVLPILITGGTFTHSNPGYTAHFLFGFWSFAGIIIIAAAVGYLSKDITLWEPAVGASLLLTTALVAIGGEIFLSPVAHKMSLFHMLGPWVIMVAVVFLLSVVGAWLGERAQNRRTKPPEST